MAVILGCEMERESDEKTVEQARRLVQVQSGVWRGLEIDELFCLQESV